jgi:hypothetical protein
MELGSALKPATLINFMNRLIRDAHRKVYLILDNLNETLQRT